MSDPTPRPLTADLMLPEYKIHGETCIPWRNPRLIEGCRMTTEDLSAVLSALDPEARARALEPYAAELAGILMQRLMEARAACHEVFSEPEWASRATIDGVEETARRLTTARAEVERLRAACVAADDLLAQYAAQWGDDYLAQKWGLSEERAQFRVAAGLQEPEPKEPT